MSVKITVIVYILICFEVGILLLILPWTQFWDDNFFLYFITGKLSASWLHGVLTSGYARGAVTGLGVLNILAGLRDIVKFRESVEAVAAAGRPAARPEEPALGREAEREPSGETHVEAAAATTAAVSDHRSPGLPPRQ
ncbi:MAG: hypothetical protein ACKVX9_02830 [Blastocatellia bacterium]